MTPSDESSDDGDSSIPGTNGDSSDVPEPNNSDSSTNPEAKSGSSTLPETNSDGATVPETNSEGATVPETNSEGATIPETNSEGARVSETNTGSSTSTEPKSGGFIILEKEYESSKVPSVIPLEPAVRIKTATALGGDGWRECLGGQDPEMQLLVQSFTEQPMKQLQPMLPPFKERQLKQLQPLEHTFTQQQLEQLKPLEHPFTDQHLGACLTPFVEKMPQHDMYSDLGDLFRKVSVNAQASDTGKLVVLFPIFINLQVPV